MSRRVTIIFAVFGLLALSILLSFVLFGKESITNYPSEGSEIIAFGDSLVFGLGGTVPGGFVSLLSKDLQVPITNLGRSGDTAEMAIERLDVVLSGDPKLVMVLVGGNDYLTRVPAEVTRKNLATIIETIQGEGAIVLLLGVRGGLLRNHFDSMYESLAEEYNTAYVSNVLEGLLGKDQFMADSIHPNDAGYAIIAERIEPVLRELID